MQTTLIPAFSDNYIYLCAHDEAAFVVDPGEADPVRDTLQRRGLTLHTILLTHPHADHIAGAPALKAAAGGVVIGPRGPGMEGVDREVRDGDTVAVPGGALQVLATPGHTAAHVCYFDPRGLALWCGDTLFAGGCGRIMGSTAAVLFASLQRLAALPEATRFYCGHEYTVDNLAFAAALEPGNDAVARRLEQARATVAARQPTLPGTIGEEKRTNPFLRAADPALARALGMPGAAPVDVFAELRRRKDRW